jgi:hypothetical protein
LRYSIVCFGFFDFFFFLTFSFFPSFLTRLEENLISLPNVAGWSVSTLPTEKTDFSEFFSLEATHVRALFGLSTSCSYNRFSVQTAENSLIRFMTLCGNMAEKKDLLEISEALIGTP